jgi:hypothetical protein
MAAGKSVHVYMKFAATNMLPFDPIKVSAANVGKYSSGWRIWVTITPAERAYHNNIFARYMGLQL